MLTRIIASSSMMFRTLIFVTLIFWWSLVFWTSSEGASGDWTKRLLQDWLGLHGAALEVVNYIVRKTAHVVYYFILSILLLNVLSWTKLHLSKTVPMCFVLAFLTSAFDEYRQSLTESRSGTSIDLIYDLIGILFAIYIYVKASGRK
jgi:VanZ family protein